jgi:hypothetical protein
MENKPMTDQTETTGWQRIMERLAEPYWRIKWWWWFLPGSPRLPVSYNIFHRHNITMADYEIMVTRWEAKEPSRGVPPSVRKHREKMTRLWGPDRSKWR